MVDQPHPGKLAELRAIYAAMGSPCAKSKRGVVVLSKDGRHVGVGFNRLPWWPAWCDRPTDGPRPCPGDEACRAACAKLCIHAEASALREARHADGPLSLIHAKVVDGALVPSGGPSCWQCARDLVEDGRVTHVWLYLEDGWRKYTLQEFYSETMRACGLPDTEP